jgi:TetR/AcrR family transcriptional repressor of nem operon
MRRTTGDFSTREKLLDSAVQLMLVKGYTATSVDDICSTAGVTKGSFFHYFKGKEELAIAALGHYWSVRWRALEGGPFHAISDPLARLYRYVDFISEMLQQPDVPASCLFGNLSQELSATHPAIREQCQWGFAQWADSLEGDLSAAQARYAPAAPFDPRSIAEHFIAVYEGALILAKAKQDVTIITQHLQHFKHYLALLFGQLP